MQFLTNADSFNTMIRWKIHKFSYHKPRTLHFSDLSLEAPGILDRREGQHNAMWPQSWRCKEPLLCLGILDSLDHMFLLSWILLTTCCFVQHTPKGSHLFKTSWVFATIILHRRFWGTWPRILSLGACQLLGQDLLVGTNTVWGDRPGVTSSQKDSLAGSVWNQP